MNIELLKYLVSLSNNEVDVINTLQLFEKYPEENYANDLYSFERLGFISILLGDDHIQAIGVNQKAIDYIKNY